MKKIICFTFIILWVSTFSIKAQTIPNGGFETWNYAVYYQDPMLYFTSNASAFYDLPQGNVRKSTDSYTGSFSAHLQTVNTNGGPALGVIYFGDFSASGVNGGIPFIGHPDSVSAYFKFNIMPGDTAQSIIALKKNGTVIGWAFGHFTGSNPVYSKFTTPILWSDTAQADTLAVMITSSDFNNPIVGSNLFIDNASFYPSGSPFPNGDFEQWNNIGNDEPDSWNTLNFICNPADLCATKSTDSYEGNYSMKIKSVQMLGGDTLAYITNGQFPTNNTYPIGGMPVSQNPDKISGYYKYFPVGPDTAYAGIFLYRWNTATQQTLCVDSMLVPLLPSNSYAYFESPVSYNEWPLADTLNISFTANNNINNGSYIGLGSTLYIDGLQLTLKPLGLNDINTNDLGTQIYPNPSINIFNIKYSSKILTLDLFDVNGRKLNDVIMEISGSDASIRMENSPKGLYYLRINGVSGEKLMLK